jgi:hypothetical protein
MLQKRGYCAVMVAAMVAANTWIMTGKRALNFAAILAAKLAATRDETVAANTWQGRGKLYSTSRQPRGNCTATARQSRGKAKCRLPRVYRNFFGSFAEVFSRQYSQQTDISVVVLEGSHHQIIIYNDHKNLT